MPKKIPEEERETEDQMARRKLGPRGEPGAPDSAKMTPQAEKELPKSARLRSLVRITERGLRNGPREFRREPRVKRVVTGIDIIKTRDRNRLGAVLAQEIGQRLHMLRRAVQGQHPG
jgi:hypothetical protein